MRTAKYFLLISVVLLNANLISAQPLEENDELRQATIDQARSIESVRSLLVQKNNNLIIEEYFRNATPDHPYNIKSASKSIISLLVGIAVDQGKISLDETLGDYFSEYFDMIWAETDGYERLDSSVTHTRRVIASKNPVYYLVIDDMSPQKKNIKNKYHLNFHVSPGSTFVEGDFLTVLIEKERNMLMGVNGTRDVNLKTYFGGIEPVGWFSRMYGQKIESNTFSYQIFTDGDAGYCSFIIPYNKSAPVLDGFLADRKNGSVYISLTINGVKYTWIVNQDIKETQFNNIQFIGKIALICQDRDSQLKYVYSMSAQMLHFSEQLIFTNEIPKSGLIVPPSIGD